MHFFIVDFSKAFNKVSHQHLYQKLHHYGIRGDTLAWLKDFLAGRQQQVLVNGEQSDATEVTSFQIQSQMQLLEMASICIVELAGG